LDDVIRCAALRAAFLATFHLPGRHKHPFYFDREVKIGRCSFMRSWLVGKKLYVGNLSYNVTDASLESLFAAYGQVRSAQVIVDRETGRSKGFGFVEMGDDNSAQAAIQALNGKEQDGRQLAVNEARPREERRPGGGGGGGGGGSRGGYGRR
jgi:cold-inducible RNA-binding protein